MSQHPADAIEANQRNWDDRVPVHLASRMYGVEGFVNDASRLSGVVEFDREQLLPLLPGRSVRGKSLVHLQCHIGLDTLSWARLGAQVTGIDFSPAALTAAKELARRCGLRARFVESDVHGATAACPEQFDIVYTGIGALPWLPDLDRWARVVADLLAPGGMFYLREGHPVLAAIDYERTDGELVLRHPYFATAEPVREDHGKTYTDGDVTLEHATTYLWSHSLAEVVQALLDAGLVLTSLREHRSVPWQALPVLVPTIGGYGLADRTDRAPLAFSLTATRPHPS